MGSMEMSSTIIGNGTYTALYFLRCAGAPASSPLATCRRPMRALPLPLPPARARPLPLPPHPQTVRTALASSAVKVNVTLDMKLLS